MAYEDDLGWPIAGLAVNVLFMPGIGTVIGGRWREGVIQIALSIAVPALVFLKIASLPAPAEGRSLDAPFTIAIIAIFAYAAVWVWAVVAWPWRSASAPRQKARREPGRLQVTRKRRMATMPPNAFLRI